MRELFTCQLGQMQQDINRIFFFMCKSLKQKQRETTGLLYSYWNDVFYILKSPLKTVTKKKMQVPE